MSQAKRCSKCGAPVSGEVMGGFCTACLLEEGLSPAELAQNPVALRYFGDYELIEEIARGGMGVVFKARQRSLNRTVAVKMILSGHLASEAQAQRFRAEARAAAALQHPGIVAIHEVGEHEGLLFFSMDYVAGQNLAQQVRDAPWAATRAAECVRDIAAAIQYAHEHGVLHRDLKPSNVLIDANGQPHVTDFGLAKQLNSDAQRSTSDPHLTLSGQVLGSPNFMPPEQAAGKHGELTPASDVYSLGAILYHCLTGRPPFVAETLAQTLRMLAEQEPVSPRLLNASVPRDLETICLKCLEKDPARRYAAAQELADDLNRFLHNEPIHARPARVVLKVHRWCLRNKALAASGTAALILLLTLAIGSPIAALRIDRERQRADKTAREAEESRKREAELRVQAEANQNQAQTEAAKSQQVARFLQDMLNGVGPSVARGRDTALLHEILDKTVERVGNDLTNQPAVKAELQATIGKVYYQIGDYDKAELLAREALDLRRTLFGDENLDVASSLSSLASILGEKYNYAEGEIRIREALAIQRKLSGETNIAAAWSLNSLGVMLHGQNKVAEAEVFYRDALRLRRELLGNDNRDVALTLNNLAGALYDLGKVAEGESMYHEAIRIHEKLGGVENPELEIVLDSLGAVLVDQGRHEEAERIASRALALQRKMLREDHVHLVRTYCILYAAFSAQGKLAQAEEMARAALAHREKYAGPTHPATLQSRSDLESALIRQGKIDQAEALRRDYNPSDRGQIYGRAGRWKEAAAALAKAVDAATSDHYPYHLLAPLLVASGDAEAYRRHCERIQVQFAGIQDSVVAERMAKACLILPGVVADFRPINQWVKIAMTAETNSSLFRYSQFVSGLAAYRQSDHARALENAQTVLGLSGTDPHPEIAAWAVIAMANHGLKQTNEAVTALSKARELAKAKLPKLEAGDLGTGWNDWIITHALLREAGSLIEGTPPDAEVFSLKK